MNRAADMLVLPLANQFRLEFGDRLNLWADTIRKLKIPVVVVGVGCQTDLNFRFDHLKPINKPVQRFVSAVLDHSATIGVRGECTAEYLRHLGFSAVDIIGCPSMYVNGADLESPKDIKEFDLSTKLTVNVTSSGEQTRFATGLDNVGHVIERAIKNIMTWNIYLRRTEVWRIYCVHLIAFQVNTA